jgi:hypothetical protein
VVLVSQTLESALSFALSGGHGQEEEGERKRKAQIGATSRLFIIQILLERRETMPWEVMATLREGQKCAYCVSPVSATDLKPKCLSA